MYRKVPSALFESFVGAARDYATTILWCTTKHGLACTMHAQTPQLLLPKRVKTVHRVRLCRQSLLLGPVLVHLSIPKFSVDRIRIAIQTHLAATPQPAPQGGPFLLKLLT